MSMSVAPQLPPQRQLPVSFVHLGEEPKISQTPFSARLTDWNIRHPVEFKRNPLIGVINTVSVRRYTWKTNMCFPGGTGPTKTESST